IGYGMESHVVDGNNILEVYSKMDTLCKDIRENPRPVLLEFLTFRMRGHEEASGTKYVPDELMAKWAAKDPISNYEGFLLQEGILAQETINALKNDIHNEIDENLTIAFEGE